TPPGSEAPRVRPAPARLLAEVARASGVAITDLLQRYSPKITVARAILARVAGAYSVSLTELAALLAISRHRASQLAQHDLDDDARAAVRRIVDRLVGPQLRAA